MRIRSSIASPHTTGVVIANNVLDGNIAARDGATGSVTGNYTTATAALFVNPSAGDLHLKATSTVLLNKVAAPPAAAGVDWDGHARPAGSTDIGADEYSTGSTPTPPNAPVNLRIVQASQDYCRICSGSHGKRSSRRRFVSGRDMVQ